MSINTASLKNEQDELEEIERCVGRLHAQWTEIAAMAHEHKDIAVLVTQVARLSLKRGDTLLVNVPNRINMEQRKTMQRILKIDLGPQQRVLVLGGGFTLSALASAVGDGVSGD